MAKAMKFHAIVRGKTLPIPDLSIFEGKRVEVIVVEDEGPTSVAQTAAVPRRRFGTLAGQFDVPEDFDSPLPDHVLSSFEGEPEKS